MLQHEKQNCVQPTRAEAIALLNDTLRKTGTGGRVMVTQSVMRLTGLDAGALVGALAERQIVASKAVVLREVAPS